MVHTFVPSWVGPHIVVVFQGLPVGDERSEFRDGRLFLLKPNASDGNAIYQHLDTHATERSQSTRKKERRRQREKKTDLFLINLIIRQHRNLPFPPKQRSLLSDLLSKRSQFTLSLRCCS